MSSVSSLNYFSFPALPQAARNTQAATGSAAVQPAAAEPQAGNIALPTAADSGLQAVGHTLQLVLNRWQQQQANTLQQAAASKRSSQGQQLDGSRMEMLKERVKNLRQMMLLAGRDKGSLRAIALQLKQITAELRQMVASATGNDQNPGMNTTLSVSVSNAASSASAGAAAQDSSASDEQAQNAAKDVSNGETGAASVGAALAQGSQQPAAQTGVAVALPGSGNTSALSSNMELQALLNSIKGIQQWLKQRSQQIHDDGMKKLQDDSARDMAAIDTMLKGGSNTDTEAGQLTIQLASPAVETASLDTGAVAAINVQA